MTIGTSVCSLALALACGIAAAQPQVIDLGVAPGGPDSYASGLSLDGSVVVGSCNCSPQRAWRWTQAGGMVLLPMGPSGGSSLAGGVSADGNHTAGSVYNSALNRRIPNFWIGNSGPLGFTLPAPWDGGSTNDASSDGTYYVGTLTNSNVPGNQTGVRFGTAVDIIPPVANRSFSSAVAISADGVAVAGTASQPSNRAFYWTSATGSQDLGLVPGASEASALGISADGSTIFGETRTSSNVISAFKWTLSGGMATLATTIPSLQPRATCSTADGSVIYGNNAYSLPAGTGLVWVNDQPAVFLHDYLASLGTDLTGWQMSSVSGASSDGSTIAGTGFRAGVQHAYVVTGLPRLCGPTIFTQPVPKLAVVGGSQTLSVSATSTGTIAYQWLDSSGVPLSDGVQPTGAVFAGTTTDTLHLANVTLADSTIYFCSVTDPCASVVSSAGRLVVNYPCGQGQETVPAGTLCTFTSQDCGNLFEFIRSTGGVLTVEYAAPISHCSDVGMRFFLDNTLVATTDFLAPGESSGVIDLGPVSPVAHTVGMEAFGREGGCNAGALEAWGGEVTITTSIVTPSISLVSSSPLACESTSASYDTIVSGGGPSLVTWEISDSTTPGDWRPIAEGLNLAISTGAAAFIGTTTPSGETLSISASSGFFDDWAGGTAVVRARALNACGEALSDEFPLTVQATCFTGCDSIDFNNDMLFPDTADIDDFLSVFSGGNCSTDPIPGCSDIDFNNDGLFPDTTDIDALLSVFSGGPCL